MRDQGLDLDDVSLANLIRKFDAWPFGHVRHLDLLIPLATAAANGDLDRHLIHEKCSGAGPRKNDNRLRRCDPDPSCGLGSSSRRGKAKFGYDGPWIALRKDN